MGLQTIDLKEGQSIESRYEVVKPLGQGFMGTVYHVIDRQLDNQSLALKVLHPYLFRSKAEQRAFQKEVIIARQLSHTNITRVYDFGTLSSGRQYLTMEFVSGCSLTELLDGHSEGVLPVQEVMFILLQIAKACAYAHTHGVIHRNLKPENVLLTRSGNVKLTDFSMARSTEDSLGLTRTGECVGSPHYMSPEQLYGETVDERTDQYSLGILAYKLLTGETPFDGVGLHDIAAQHLSEALPVEKLKECDVPEWLSALLQKSTAVSPNQRFLNMRVLAAELDKKFTQNEHDVDAFRKTIVRTERKLRGGIFQSREVGRFNSVLSYPLAFCLVGYLLLNDDNARTRMLADLMRIERHQSIDTSLARRALGFHQFNVDGPALLEAALQNDDIVLKAFLDSGMDLNYQDKDGLTLSHYLSRGSQDRSFDVVFHNERLINLAIRDNEGNTPAMTAVKASRHRVIQFLSRHSKLLTIPDARGVTPIFQAVADQNPAMVAAILNSLTTSGLFQQAEFDQRGRTILHLASELEDLAILSVLSKFHLDFNVRDRNGRNALMYIVQHPASKESFATFDYLIEQGADLAARDNDGRAVVDYIDSDATAWREKIARVLGEPTIAEGGS